jgi:hypothetical protein
MDGFLFFDKYIGKRSALADVREGFFIMVLKGENCRPAKNSGRQYFLCGVIFF